ADGQGRAVRRAGRGTGPGCGLERVGHPPGLCLVPGRSDRQFLLRHQQQPAVRRARRGPLQAYHPDGRRGDPAIRAGAGGGLSRGRGGRPDDRGRRRADRRAPRFPAEGIARYRLQPVPELPARVRMADAAGYRPRDELVRLMQALADLPPGVDEALELVGRFDDCLTHGFARLGDEQRRSLESLAAACDGSPLGPSVAAAVAAVGRSEFVPRSFLTLAGARVAILGAVHDALLAQVRAVLGRPDGPVEEGPPLSPGGASPALASAQHWLAELAIAGFRQLEE